MYIYIVIHMKIDREREKGEERNIIHFSACVYECVNTKPEVQ